MVPNQHGKYVPEWSRKLKWLRWKKTWGRTDFWKQKPGNAAIEKLSSNNARVWSNSEDAAVRGYQENGWELLTLLDRETDEKEGAANADIPLMGKVLSQRDSKRTWVWWWSALLMLAWGHHPPGWPRTQTRDKTPVIPLCSRCQRKGWCHITFLT